MITVKSQKEFDAAYKNGEREFIIEGFWAELWGNSHAELWGNSHAELWGNSHAVLWGNSHAELRENSHAELWGNSHAELRENSHAELWDFSMAHKLSTTVTIEQFSPSAFVARVHYPADINEWCKLKGIKPVRGRINLWKATKMDGTDFYSGKVLYDTDEEIICPDWDEKYSQECGFGLHLADSPSAARFFISYGEKFRLFEVSAALKDCVCFGGLPDYPMKIRAKACKKVKEYLPDYNPFFKEEGRP